jgi:N-acetylmuramoyl-L-alanine amidase
MRPIKYIVLHCTGAIGTQSTASIKNYWIKVMKWKSVGYHYLISMDGSFEQLEALERPTNGVAGYNANAIHICYKGGLNGVDTRTEMQKRTLEMLVKQMKAKFPDSEIKGHRDFLVKGKAGWKECPGFSVDDWLKTIKL